MKHKEAEEDRYLQELDELSDLDDLAEKTKNNVIIMINDSTRKISEAKDVQQKQIEKEEKLRREEIEKEEKLRRKEIE